MNVFIPDKQALAGYLLVALLCGACHRRLSSSPSLLVLLYCLPFTIMHESAHLVAAFLTGGQPSSFTVIPRRRGNGWVLGSVSTVPTLLSACPTALAPLGWLLFGYLAMIGWERRPTALPEYLLPVILYACAAASLPSRQDMRVLGKNPLSLLLWLGVTSALFWVFLL